jgi:hypothetical protein
MAQRLKWDGKQEKPGSVLALAGNRARLTAYEEATVAKEADGKGSCTHGPFVGNRAGKVNR